MRHPAPIGSAQESERGVESLAPSGEGRGRPSYMAMELEERAVLDLRKAAILLLSLPEEEAGLLLQKLPPDQLEAVSIEMAGMGQITAEEQEAAIYGFAEAGAKTLTGAEGSLKHVRSLLEKALGKRAASLVDRVTRAVQNVPFDGLRGMDPQNLATFLRDEHPQTIALILSFLPPAHGAQILAGLAAEQQLEVVQRIAQMGQTTDDVIQEVERGLSQRMSGATQQVYQEAGGAARAAEILDVAEHLTKRSILENLAQDSPELTEQIRRLMFAFEDIAHLSDKDIQTLLKDVETAQWATALKGTSQEIKDKILGNMSKRAAKVLLEEMEYQGPVRVSEVATVQRQIVDIARLLEDHGQINLEEEVLVEEYVS